MLLLAPACLFNLALLWCGCSQLFFGKVRLGPLGVTPFPPGAPAEKRPGCPSDEELLPHVPKLVKAWSLFEKALEGKQYVAGDEFTIGDICPAVQANRFIKGEGFGYPELAPANFPNVCAWFERVSVRTCMRERKRHAISPEEEILILPFPATEASLRSKAEGWYNCVVRALGRRGRRLWSTWEGASNECTTMSTMLR